MFLEFVFLSFPAHFPRQHFILSVVPVLLHPLSRGRILLKSKQILDHPVIEPNYLTEKLDVATLADACLTAMRRCRVCAPPSLLQFFQGCQPAYCPSVSRSFPLTPFLLQH